jgi:hypothetical protein
MRLYETTPPDLAKGDRERDTGYEGLDNLPDLGLDVHGRYRNVATLIFRILVQLGGGISTYRNDVSGKITLVGVGGSDKLCAASVLEQHRYKGVVKMQSSARHAPICRSQGDALVQPAGTFQDVLTDPREPVGIVPGFFALDPRDPVGVAGSVRSLRWSSL